MPEKNTNHKQQPINGQPSGLKLPKKRLTNKVLLLVAGIAVVIIVDIFTSCVVWYNIQLSPVSNDISQLRKVTIPSGSTSSQIGKELEKQSIIRSALAFDTYVRLTCKNIVLQAGIYRLSPAEIEPQIIEHFEKGLVDQFSITFYPGATLTDNTNKPESRKLDVMTILKKAGYSDTEIKAALRKTYDGPLFAGKPATAELEGYICGETYNFNAGASVEEILNSVFKEFYAKIQENNLIKGFKDHGLNLYQGITLASIIQREITNPLDQSKPTLDQKQAAQVFYSRLKIGMKLGSDVTYQYITDKLGVPRDYNFDSPYNTRMYPDLTPGPISAPGLSALIATANPANTDFLYFLSDSKGVMYYAHTEAEHQSNIVNHCKEACDTP